MTNDLGTTKYTTSVEKQRSKKKHLDEKKEENTICFACIKA